MGTEQNHKDEKNVYSASERSPFKSFLIRIGTLLTLFVILEQWLQHSCRLPQTSYHEPIIFFALLKSIGIAQILFLIFVFFLLFKYQKVHLKWTGLPIGSEIKLGILLIAFLLVWPFSTYNVNPYFNGGHYFDRILLLLFFGLIVWRPVFVFPFLIQLVAIMWQFNYPIGGYSLAEQNLPLRVLIAFMAMLVIQHKMGASCVMAFFFFAICLVASHYWYPGLGKIRLNWITHGHIYQLLFSTYANGWLGFLEPEVITRIAKFVSNFDWPMRIMTLIFEFGSMFVLWRRQMVPVYFCGWVCFHLGVFALSGIFFWKWIVLDMTVLIIYLRVFRNGTVSFFTRSHFLLSLVLICSSGIWTRPVNLSWYDTRMSYTYRFEVAGQSDQVYTLSAGFFKPYDYQFTLGGFRYLIDKPLLGLTWGVTGNRTLAENLLNAKTTYDVLELESKDGLIYHDQERADRFYNFLAQFFRHHNSRYSERPYLRVFQAPPLLWTFPRGNAYKNQEPIKRVYVRQITSLYDGEKYSEIRNRLVHEIEIPIDEGTDGLFRNRE